MPNKTGDPTRIVSVCVHGRPAKNFAENRVRTEMVQAVAAEIERAGWDRLGAVLFPGGFFYTDVYTGDQDFDGRRKYLESLPFSDGLVQASHKLAEAYLVCGVDSAPGKPRRMPSTDVDKGDEYCVAWNSGGVQSVARKVFPTKDAGLICYADDFGASRRLIKLKTGRIAVLCACYDVYGCEFASPKVRKSSRPGYINRIADSTGMWEGKELRTLRKNCVENFAQLLRGNNVSICLGAVHQIERLGGDNYWERYGVANCSAALRGLCICATHYWEGLPDAVNPHTSTLAASDVPARHVTQGHNSKAHRMAPLKYLYAYNDKMLARLFQY